MLIELDTTAKPKEFSKKPRDKSNIEYYNCYKKEHYAKKYRNPKKKR